MNVKLSFVNNSRKTIMLINLLAALYLFVSKLCHHQTLPVLRDPFLSVFVKIVCADHNIGLYSLIKGNCTTKLEISMFCELSQNYQLLFEKNNV